MYLNFSSNHQFMSAPVTAWCFTHHGSFPVLFL
jgi:hypothetical protein